MKHLLFAALIVMGSAQVFAGEKIRCGSDAELLSVENTDMYTANVSLSFAGEKESYSDCSALSIAGLSSDPNRNGPSYARSITCRRKDSVLTIQLPEVPGQSPERAQAFIARSSLKGDGIVYRGGIIASLPCY